MTVQSDSDRGADTLGSVRVPAALNGMVGSELAYEVAPSAGVYPLALSCYHVVRSVDKADLGYRLLADRPMNILPPETRSLTVGRISVSDVEMSVLRIEPARDFLACVGFATNSVYGFPGLRAMVCSALLSLSGIDISTGECGRLSTIVRHHSPIRAPPNPLLLTRGSRTSLQMAVS